MVFCVKLQKFAEMPLVTLFPVIQASSISPKRVLVIFVQSQGLHKKNVLSFRSYKK